MLRFVDILKVVEMAAANTDNFGREYSCGVSNVGVVELVSNPGAKSEGDVTSLFPTGVYYCTSHARNGVLCQLSSQTVNGELCGCLQFPLPIVNKSKAGDLLQLLKLILDWAVC